MKLKRLSRYLLQYPELVFRYENQRPQKKLKVFVDSNWAGCLKSRKSTSGGVVALGSHIIKSWSTTQGSIALSSGEAELYAIVEGAAKAMGVQSTMTDMGSTIDIQLYTDSSAAKGVVQRNGVGKIRHLQTKYLWVQAALKDKKFEVFKIEGKKNSADVATKHLSRTQMLEVLGPLGVRICRR